MIVDAIKKALERAIKKGWEETYWFIDIHDTVLKPSYKRGEVSTEFFPFAKETLQILTS